VRVVGSSSTMRSLRFERGNVCMTADHPFRGENGIR
jgi:hypothetical protein